MKATLIKINRKGDQFARLFDGITADMVRSAAADLNRIREARTVWAAVGGPQTDSAKLFTQPSHSPKASKAWKYYGRKQWILYLAPASLSGLNLCRWSTKACRSACLNTAGRGSMDTVQAGRVARVQFAAADPLGFAAILYREVSAMVRNHPSGAARFNGTSDNAIESIPALACAMTDHPKFQFLDYTKANLAQRPTAAIPANYTIARSVWTDRETIADIVNLHASGVAVSVLVSNAADIIAAYPDTFVDASKSDLWMLGGNVIGLLKGLGEVADGDMFDAKAIAAAMASRVKVSA